MVAGLSWIEISLLVALFGAAFYFGRKESKKSTLVGYNEAQPIIEHNKQCYAVQGKNSNELSKKCQNGTSLLTSEINTVNPNFSGGFCCVDTRKHQTKSFLDSERSLRTSRIDQIPMLPKPNNIIRSGLSDALDSMNNGVLTNLSYSGPMYQTTWSLDPDTLPDSTLGKWMDKNQMAQVYCDRMGGKFTMESNGKILCSTEKYNPRINYLGAKSV